MHNPFDILETRLRQVEILLLELVQQQRAQAAPAPELGGLDLAQQITGLSKARLYALVSTRSIPHAKRGNKLFFNRAELLLWVAAGRRATQSGH
ncbi:helix-turn-helix domain-containing protein [Hymenobacter tibetensis]|uniref:Helix-turn-helix domain-containing protein n=1 Tax=Hymenobacter tibetensis TaxID=497967 RepID=A0ABY4CWA5_9BACT|nr:helix-turn-helix domain-containing protein [Hymenobacter tibetensis]UOG74332.1 helix-turn-helix domain-containing protein [Hymenobacter tibetensis]